MSTFRLRLKHLLDPKPYISKKQILGHLTQTIWKLTIQDYLAKALKI